ncbi:ferredoxin [Nocardia alba]|uniref:Ferredoxin n=1 Tax=Nocardia alba TaxID=225051 RepID=A0A4V2PBD2_9NOCA|nr:ferredoxin [Nocardia alba]TCJ96925.1 ferredoxin [Nocardia alba]
MRIAADRTRCEGHGMCEALLPDIFRVDDDGIVEVSTDQVPEAELDDVRLAVDSCPVEALRLSD